MELTGAPAAGKSIELSTCQQLAEHVSEGMTLFYVRMRRQHSHRPSCGLAGQPLATPTTGSGCGERLAREN